MAKKKEEPLTFGDYVLMFCMPFVITALCLSVGPVGFILALIAMGCFFKNIKKLNQKHIEFTNGLKEEDTKKATRGMTTYGEEEQP